MLNRRYSYLRIWQPSGIKRVNGSLDNLNRFTFTLEECDEKGNKIDGAVYSGYNDSQTGELIFEPITYMAEGDYWYRLYENAGRNAWYTYDTTVYLIKVHVSADGQDLKAEPQYYILESGGALSDASALEFNNIKAKAVNVRYHWVGDVSPDDVTPPSDDSVPEGTKFIAEPQYPSEENMVFAGWYTDRACTKPYANGTVLTEDLDLYGYWTKITVGDDEILVTYMWDLWECVDGTPTDVTPPSYDVIKKGTYYTPKSQEPTAQGFSFHGWYDWDSWDDFTGGVLTRNTTLLGYWIKDAAPDTGSLTISKIVAGDGDKTKAFTFMVAFTDGNGVPLTEIFNYTGTGAADGMLTSGGTVSLAHGQSVTITGIPIGTNYVVVENEANRDGYPQYPAGAGANRPTYLCGSHSNDRCDCGHHRVG